MASLRPRRGRGSALALLVGALLGFAAPAQADHPTTTPPGAAEARQRASEDQALGPEHAAEHEQQRAVAGSGAPSAAGSQPAAAGDPAQDGRWSTPFSIPVIGIHSALLPTGKVMLWSRPLDGTGDDRAEAWLWDPTKQPGDPQRFKRVDPPLFRNPETGALKPANIYCSGQSHMADGQLLVTGGNLAYPGSGNPPRADYAGLNTVYTFNPFNETWTEQPRMGKGRWYPSQALLPDGRTLLMSGLDETGADGATNKEVELFSPPSALDGQGSVTKIGDRGGPGQPPDGDTYPHLAVLPSGRTLVAGPNASDSWLLNPLGTGSRLEWTPLPELDRRRLWGSGVLRPGETGGSTAFTLIGGSQPDFSQEPPGDALGVPTSVTFDESRPLTEGWKAAPSLNVGRSHPNTVLLPDKSMVTVGGGLGTSPEGGPQDYGAGLRAANDEHRQVELLDPATDSWRLGAAQMEPRAYHSTALLLPDGRVMSAGDDVNGGTDQDTAEIYEPPYLFKGPRPVLDSAPLIASYGASFYVQSSGPAPARAVLMAPGAVTHANDMSQRTVELALEQRADGVKLTAPARAALAPPGYYMLFLVSDQGVPSVARFVRLGTDPPSPGRLEVAQEAGDSGSARFSFQQGPLESFELASGEERSTVVAAGTRTVRQTSAPDDYGLRSIGCSDGTAGSATARSVTVAISSGQTVRCTFTNTRDAKPSPPKPSPAPVTPKSPSIFVDRSGPSIAFNNRRGLRGGRVLRGRVSDPSGVKKMQVAVTSARDGRCRSWSPRRRRFGRASQRACGRPALFLARLRRSAGGYVWTARLGARLRRGRYRVTLRAEDARGNVTRGTGSRGARVTVR